MNPRTDARQRSIVLFAFCLMLVAAATPALAVEAGAKSGMGGSGEGVFVAEIVGTAMFLYVILGVTGRRATPAAAGLTIGLCLTLIHLIMIPIDGTSVNPARSLGVAWFGGGHALGQVWLFIVAPIVGAIIAGATHTLITGEQD